MTDLELAKHALYIRNTLTFHKSIHPVALRSEMAEGLLSSASGAKADPADVTNLLSNLVKHGYLKEFAGCYYATSDKSYEKIGPDSDPWTGWT